MLLENQKEAEVMLNTNPSTDLDYENRKHSNPISPVKRDSKKQSGGTFSVVVDRDASKVRRGTWKRGPQFHCLLFVLMCVRRSDVRFDVRSFWWSCV